MESMVKALEVYKGKRVLVTGHTGFKGSWLSLWLHQLGADVIGVALDPLTPRDCYMLSGVKELIFADLRGDIRDASYLKRIFTEYKPEIVFHLAAQPLVRLSYDKPVETYEVNVMGTINVMEAIRATDSVRSAVMITTDKCYENKEQIWGYRETDAMGGYDPYSSSKGAAEIAIASWRRSFFNPSDYGVKHQVALASVRAGNVVGGGDWAVDRIVPDCIRALEANRPIELRNPQAIRPWQHVLEPLGGYLLLAAKMLQSPTEFCQGWNFGPNPESVATVQTVADLMVKYYGRGTTVDVSNPNAVHEANLLTLDITKAQRLLGWHPRLSLEECIRMTVDWYRSYQSKDVYKLCCDQILEYMQL